MLYLVLEEGSPFIFKQIFTHFTFITLIFSFTLLKSSLLICFPKTSMIFHFVSFMYVIPLQETKIITSYTNVGHISIILNYILYPLSCDIFISYL